MSSIRTPANPMLDHNNLPFYPLTAASQVVKRDGTKLEINGEISVDHADEADTSANAAKLGDKDPSYYYAGPPNYTYGGRDLSTVFDSVAALHAAVAAGDFTNIRIGDYWPITLSGTVKDYAANESKTLNHSFKLEVAGINTYLQYGDTMVSNNHIVFCSRDLLPWTVQMRSQETTWYDSAQTNPWLGSHLYQTLNAADGVLPILAATDIGAYMYSGSNGNGMRFLGETKASGATAATGWGWIDRGKLFLPTEREVWGQDIWSEHGYGGGAGVQWPIFSGSLRHIVKGLGDGGSRYGWWVQSSFTGSTSHWCNVNYYGYPDNNSSSHTWIGAPLCFLFV